MGAKDLILNVVNPVSARFRQKRFGTMMSSLQLTQSDHILDVGGTPSTWLGTGFEANVTLMNINFTEPVPEPLRGVEGDATDMTMFADDSFDVVFSNSVIEHVGALQDQQRMAAEVARVGKAFYVQTPNRSFLLEPHYLFPGFQFLPAGAQRSVAKWWPFSFPKLLGFDPIEGLETLRLLTNEEFTSMFGGATILHERVLGLSKSMTAVDVSRR